ncbi:short chain dehydrogenase [Nitzschia inconspicua]|uniref:Short chain dehydrogenase n=1 Tax=Nitzschia inconspicua TaxID=303405 RepID=A0A9K3Q4I4_9STRA|nr:short chain dehydrogenase [Nitzschia inconspicua]
MILSSLFSSRTSYYPSTYGLKEGLPVVSSSLSSMLLQRDLPGLRVFATIGGIIVARFAYRLAKYARRHFVPEMPTIRRPVDFLETRYGSGSWVLVMGMNQLGCAFAHQFAKRSFSLVLVDDDRQRLDQHLQRFQKEYPLILIKTITTNFELAATEGWVDSILKELSKLSISVLVNATAGVDSKHDERFPSSSDSEETRKSLVVQVFPSMLLTQAMFPRLKERYNKLQIRGAIITLTATTPLHSSNDTKSPSWLSYALYQSMCHFSTTFAKTLGVDATEAIDFLIIHPGPNISCDRETKSMLAITPQEFATASIQQLRYGVQETSGWWDHELQQWFMENISLKCLHYAWMWRKDKNIQRGE